MTPAQPIGRFHVITDTVIQDRYSHADLARAAIAGGADSIQLRDKNLTDEELAAVARAVLDVCRGAGVPLIVNDRIEVAATVGADGVHLGADDAPIAEARAKLGPGAIVGGTAGTLEDAVAAEERGADYVGFGHIFPTTSKQKPGTPLGLEPLAAVAARLAIPVIAIGGIHARNAAAVVGAGAWGIAVIAAVCGSEAPEAAAREIRMSLDAAQEGSVG